MGSAKFARKKVDGVVPSISMIDPHALSLPSGQIATLKKRQFYSLERLDQLINSRIQQTALPFVYYFSIIR